MTRALHVPYVTRLTTKLPVHVDEDHGPQKASGTSSGVERETSANSRLSRIALPMYASCVAERNKQFLPYR